MSLAENLSPNPRERIGANNPPLAEALADRYADLLAQVETVADRAHSLPKKIGDDIALGRLGDVSKEASKLKARIDDARKTEVEPHLTAQRETNGFFNVAIDRLKKLVDVLGERATDYQRAKAADERRVREDAARKAREEEDRQRRIAEEAAAKGRAGKALLHEDRAEEAGETAARAEVAAKASSADLTRVRSGTGTVATMRGGWDFVIEDATKVPLDVLRPYFSLDVIEKAVRAHVRTHKDSIAIPGVRIFKDEKASFR